MINVDFFKSVMTDERITIEAKAIYSFLVFYNDGQSVEISPKDIAKFLNINPSRYYKHFEQLKKYGYVIVEQKNENGKFSINEYILK